MAKSVFKWFNPWSFDREEIWLNRMAAKGLCSPGSGGADTPLKK